MKIGSGQMVLAWCFACALAISVLVAIYNYSTAKLNTNFAIMGAQFANSDAVFLGSSLTRFALPKHGQGGAVSEIGADLAYRVGLSNGTETEIISLTELAINAGVGTIFIEINPILTRFNKDFSQCFSPFNLSGIHKKLQQAARALLPSQDFMRGGVQSANYARHTHFKIEAIEKNYPLKFVGPCRGKDWSRMMDIKPTNTKIILVAMPRAALAKALVGTDDMVKFQTSAQSFANSFGVSLFVPDQMGTWSDDHFVDQAHMNPKGAVRFRKELAVWWKAQQ